MLRVLASNPTRWREVYALSTRGASAGLFEAPNVRYVGVDLLAGPEEVGERLKKQIVTAAGEVVVGFFFAYKESADLGRMGVENVALLRNFVEGAAAAGVGLKRIVLQTGGKHYGVHLGPYSVPAEEDDPRVHLVPNFYYDQEDLLAKLGPVHGFDYVVVRPMTIIGAVKGNFLNLAMALGLYLAVTKELGDPPIFSGTFTKYHSAEALSNATTNAYMEEWCALTPACANEAFNATNGDVITWARLFPQACAHFGLAPPAATQFQGAGPRPATGVFPTRRPIDGGEPARWELRNSWQLWAAEERTIAAWKSLAGREGLDEQAFFGASWGYADRNMGLMYNKLESMAKARRFGFLASVDSGEGLMEVFAEGQRLGILPRGA